MAQEELDQDDTVDATANTPAPPAAQPAQKPHPQRLVNQARSLGFGDDEIAIYTTAELLHAINAELSHRALKPVAPPEKQPEIDWGTDEEGKPVDPATLHPTLRKAIRDMHEAKLAYGKQSAEFKDAQAKFEEREERWQAAEQHRAEAAHWDRFDELCDTLPKLFGKGGRKTLDPKSPEAKRRANLAKECMSTASTLEEQFADACETIYGERPGKKAKPAPEEEVEEELPEDEEEQVAVTRASPRGGKLVFPSGDEAADKRRWNSSNGTSPGSHRRSPDIEEDGPKKAAKEVKKMLRARGVKPGAEGIEEDLLPD